MKKKLTIKKFDGDDQYSWAVFSAADVKGKRSPIFFGEASPIVCGLSRASAQSYKRKMEKNQNDQCNYNELRKDPTR